MIPTQQMAQQASEIYNLRREKDDWEAKYNVIIKQRNDREATIQLLCKRLKTLSEEKSMALRQLLSMQYQFDDLNHTVSVIRKTLDLQKNQSILVTELASTPPTTTNSKTD